MRFMYNQKIAIYTSVPQWPQPNFLHYRVILVVSVMLISIPSHLEVILRRN